MYKTFILATTHPQENIGFMAAGGKVPRRFFTKSSSFIFLSGLTLGLYMSVLRRMMAKARMKMVSGFLNCRTTPGLQMQ